MIFYYLLLILVSANLLYYLYYAQISNTFKLIDHADNKRKIHSGSIPRSGGIFFLITMLILFINELFFTQPYIMEWFFIDSISEVLSLYILFFIIISIGIYDDRYNLNANKKMIYTSMCILFFLLLDPSLVVNELRFSFTDHSISIDRIGLFFTLLCFILLLNALNMFDGINLQLSLYVCILFMFLFLNSIASILVALMLIPTFFFILLNIRGKIFLGDGGSLSLAFILGYILIKSYNLNDNYLYCDQIFILFLLPGLDMMRVSFVRLMEGGSMFNADRNHLHHLLTNKYGYFKIIIFIHLALIFSLILMHFMINSLYIIFFMTCTYLLIIFYLKKNI